MTDHGEPDRPALADDSVEDLYDHAPCGYLSTYPDGVLARVNETFLSWTGYTREELVGRRRFVDLLPPGGRIYHETHYAPLLRMQGAVRALAMDLVRADGSRLPVLINSRLTTDADGRAVAVRTSVFDATDRKQYEVELVAARRRAEQVAAWVQTLEQVVAELAAVSGVDEVAGIVARAGISLYAAAASAVWLLDPETGGYRFADGVGDGSPVDLPPVDPARQDVGLARGEVVEAADGDAAFPRVTAALVKPSDDGAAYGGLLLVPLVVLDQPVGLFALLLTEGAPALAPEDRRLLQTLGRQVGQALERARVSDEQRNVATILQRSMLPSELPDDPRLALSPYYRPADDQLAVGGDWYDAFCLDEHRIAVVVGDVVGRGLHAAAVMGQLRSAVRALAAVDAGPALLLERLDTFVSGVPAAELATLAYAEIDLRDGTFAYACAGHPPPVVVDAAGRVGLLWDGRSAPLGAHFSAQPRPEARDSLRAGSRLALYTDGLVERRTEALDTSIEGFASMFAEWATTSMSGLAERITQTVLGADATGDDVCLLVVAYRDLPTFTYTLAPDPARVAGLRADLGRWLSTHGIDGDDHHAAVLACTEAVTVAVDRASGGRTGIDVLVTFDAGLLRVRVGDSGRRLQGAAGAAEQHALAVIRALMDPVTVDRSNGTVVTMQRVVGG